MASHDLRKTMPSSEAMYIGSAVARVPHTASNKAISKETSHIRSIEDSLLPNIR